MDSILNQMGGYLHQVINELGQIASRINGNGWVCISVVLLVAGWFWLRGEKIRST